MHRDRRDFEGNQGDVVSMLTNLGLEQLQNYSGDRNRLCIIAHPLNRPADGRTVYIQPATDFASGERQFPDGNITDQSASARDLVPPCRTGQILFVGAKIPATAGRSMPAGCSCILRSSASPARFSVASTNSLLPRTKDRFACPVKSNDIFMGETCPR